MDIFIRKIIISCSYFFWKASFSSLLVFLCHSHTPGLLTSSVIMCVLSIPFSSHSFTLPSAISQWLFRAFLNFILLSVLLAMEESYWIARKEWEKHYRVATFAPGLHFSQNETFPFVSEEGKGVAQLQAAKWEGGTFAWTSLMASQTSQFHYKHQLVWCSASQLLFLSLPTFPFPQIMEELLGVSQPHKDQSYNPWISGGKKMVTNFNWAISLHWCVLAHIFKDIS